MFSWRIRERSHDSMLKNLLKMGRGTGTLFIDTSPVVWPSNMRMDTTISSVQWQARQLFRLVSYLAESRFTSSSAEYKKVPLPPRWISCCTGVICCLELLRPSVVTSTASGGYTVAGLILTSSKFAFGHLLRVIYCCSVHISN